jgi:hypothetical protein
VDSSGSYEDSNEPESSIKDGRFLDQVLENASPSWRYS